MVGIIEALKECVTEDGAVCWRSREYAEKRIRYIDQIARAALDKVEVATTQTPYRMGYAAAQSNPRGINPFRVGTQAHEDWERGFDHATLGDDGAAS